MRKLDLKDKKILAELVLNSRIPINQLAKKVGISREVATYRINKLVKDKIILSFYSVIEESTLGFSRYTCFFKLKGISESKEKEFIDYLIKHDFVTYLGPVIGKWNLVFDLLAKDRKHLEDLLKSIESKISNYLDSYIVMTTSSEQEMFPTKMLGINKQLEHKTLKKIKLDKVDLKILEMISGNSRIEYKELAGKLKLTGNAIKYRIKNLENSGVIQGYTISINMRKLGYEWYNIQLKILNRKKENEVRQFLKQNSNVIYYYSYVGNENWDLDVGIIVKDSLGLRDFILKLMEKFGDILKMYDSYVI
ncbi:MAG: Lrp/AsnC family transcriptional regulator, partial [Candidatus Nanoarchaeia archaeon]